MIKVIIESPYAGDVAENKYYLQKCMLDCFERGEAPYASHALYTGCLDDTIPSERQLGIDAGLIWGECADKTVVYTDRGISRGMEYGIESAHHLGRAVEYRSIL